MNGPIGREAEREVAAIFVAAAADGSAVLEIVGEGGIGKTTLFRFAVESARLAGTRVLVCGLTEAESTMSFAGLTDLLHDVEIDLFEQLPAPQGRALAVATLREAPSDSAIDERAIGTGLASLLMTLSERGPLVVAIDDTQWLDQASADVVAFALHRLGSRSVGLLTCRRVGMGASGLTATLDAPHWKRTLALRGMSAAALFHVVREQVGVTLSRPTLLRITEAAQGNPFLAVELGRATTSRRDTADGLFLPDNLQLLVAHRLSALSDEGRDALLVAACAGRPTLALLTEMGLRLGVEEAEAAHVVSVEEGRVLFEHPLLSAAVVQAASPPAIRATHARLGASSSEPEARARHLALASPEPDALTSVALDEATVSAEARGAMVAAAELARLALDRTVAIDVNAAWRRRLRLAQLLHAAGSAVEAGAVLADVDRSCPPGRLRAEANLVLTEVAYQTTTTERALVHAATALDEAGDDASLRARALLSLAALTTDGHEMVRFVALARRCLEDGQVADPTLLAWAAIEDVSARFSLGEGLDRTALDQALSLERTGRKWRSGDQVAAIRPVLLKWADEHEEALRGLAELRERAEQEGNEGLLPYVIGHVPGILLHVDRFAEAVAASAEHLSHALATGQEGQRMQALYNVSLVDAHLGKLHEAAAIGHEVLTWSEVHVDRWMEMSASGVLGFTALSAGDLSQARWWLDRWWSCSQAEGIVDPGVSRFHGDHIEALIGLGALAEATAQTDILQHRAEAARRVSAAAVAARCRALLAATAGDQPLALSFADTALELHAACPSDFDRARTLLVKGVVHRRAKEKGSAKKCLEEAFAIFARLGAKAFSSRTESELERIGTRVTSAFELTATERRIAELTASGLTNRQVAEQSFMSPKTVEANLARVYRKLGITSRAELGAVMLQMK